MTDNAELYEILQVELAGLVAGIQGLGLAFSGDDLMAAWAAALDGELGGLATVVHVAGPTIEGGVLCTRCGAVLQDHFGGAEVDETGPVDWDLRRDHGWGEGTLVWELYRWGAPTRNPHALGVMAEGQTEPDEDQLERWCQPRGDADA